MGRLQYAARPVSSVYTGGLQSRTDDEVIPSVRESPNVLLWEFFAKIHSDIQTRGKLSEGSLLYNLGTAERKWCRDFLKE